jgi:Arc/MetJ family transcription regulator
MATIEERVAELSELKRAHQDALDALLRMRLEGRNGQALASAAERAQRAADVLFAARLDHELSRPAPPLPLERSA